MLFRSQHMQSVLYQVSKIHFLDALIGQILQKNNVELSREWKDSIAKAIRRVILFDTERMNICSFMEQNRIWYLPLKGIIFNHYHPGNIMEDDNIFMCEHMTGLPVLAKVQDNATELETDADVLSALYDEVKIK